MSFSLNIRNRATQDLRSQANYIFAHGSSTKASQFLQAAESTFEQLRKTPEIGRRTEIVMSQLGLIRQWHLKGFKDYLVFYQVNSEQVDILRILHGKRDLAEILSSLDEEV